MRSRCSLCLTILLSFHARGFVLVGINNNNFPEFRGSQRGELSLSEMLSAGAAFQRSFTVQQFAGF